MGLRSSALAVVVTAEAQVDAAFWSGRRVLVTGHTGFKGGWLSLWLQTMGARVAGFSCGVPTEVSLYELARVAEGMELEQVGDVRDAEALARVTERFAPEVVVHMAAQPLVRQSFVHPRETFEINVMGTVNVLEAARRASGVRVVLVVTSDKSYENRGWEWGYREDEAMGGHDPYSASKGAAELVTAAYRRSFFTGADETVVASARAGNVIGGGDWAPERLIPDIVRAAVEGTTLSIRNPTAVRPWQHVLSPLSGYLRLAEAIWEDPQLAGGWNFGPAEDDAQPVSWIVERMRERWGGRPAWESDPGPHPHEAAYLKLDSSRARRRLGWTPVVPLGLALDTIVDWHQAHAAGADMREITLRQLHRLAVSPAGEPSPGAAAC